MFGKLIALILVLAGVVLVYDARPLTNKWFGFGDQNEGASRTKNLRIFICYNRCNNNILHQLILHWGRVSLHEIPKK